MTKILPVLEFSFFKYWSTITSDICLLFWHHRIKKMLLISLIAYSGAIIHPAAAAKENYEKEFTTFNITEEKYNSFSQEERAAFIVAFINEYDGSVQDAFFNAAERGLVWALVPLIEKGADIDDTDSNNQTALDIAAENDNAQTARFLVAQGADVNGAGITTIDESAPLHWAILNSNEELAIFLIENEATLDSLHDNQYSSLYLAAARGFAKTVELLVKKGARIDIPNNNGETALHVAAKKGRINIVNFMIDEADANINDTADEEDLATINDSENGFDCPTVLHSAASACQTEMIKLLLERGANILATDHHGMNSLEVIGNKNYQSNNKIREAAIMQCAETLIDGYRAQLARQYPTKKYGALSNDELTNLGDLELFSQDIMDDIIRWLPDNDLHNFACVSKVNKKHVYTMLYRRFLHTKKEKFTAFIQPALERARKKNNQWMVKFLEQKLEKYLKTDQSEECPTGLAENKPKRKRAAKDDDLPPAKHPKNATTNEAVPVPCALVAEPHCALTTQAMSPSCSVPQEHTRQRLAPFENICAVQTVQPPAQLGLDAPYGVFRPQPMGTGCAVARELDRQRMNIAHQTAPFENMRATQTVQPPRQLGLDAPYGVFRPQPSTGCAVAMELGRRQRMHTTYATHADTITSCPDCESFNYPIEKTHLLICCFKTICKYHYSHIAASNDPRCPYCKKPLEHMDAQ